jgi:hypothetical protein
LSAQGSWLFAPTCPPGEDRCPRRTGRPPRGRGVRALSLPYGLPEAITCVKWSVGLSAGLGVVGGPLDTCDWAAPRPYARERTRRPEPCALRMGPSGLVGANAERFPGRCPWRGALRPSEIGGVLLALRDVAGAPLPPGMSRGGGAPSAPEIQRNGEHRHKSAAHGLGRRVVHRWGVVHNLRLRGFHLLFCWPYAGFRGPEANATQGPASARALLVGWGGVLTGVTCRPHGEMSGKRVRSGDLRCLWSVLVT